MERCGVVPQFDIFLDARIEETSHEGISVRHVCTFSVSSELCEKREEPTRGPEEIAERLECSCDSTHINLIYLHGSKGGVSLNWITDVFDAFPQEFAVEFFA